MYVARQSKEREIQKSLLTMKVLVWNYQEAAMPSFHKYAKLLVSKYGPDLCGFVETQLEMSSLLRIQCLFGPYWDVYMVPSKGLAGDIVVTWHQDLGQVTFSHTDRQICFSMISSPNSPSWIIGLVYASNQGLVRRTLWQMATNVLSLDLLTLLLGDFNCLLHSQDKLGGKPF